MNEVLDCWRKVIPKSKTIINASNVSNQGSFLNNITVFFLFGCFLLVSSQQHFGTPIHCMTNSENRRPIPENVLNNYCFMSTTYTVVSVNKDPEAYPGVKTEGPESTIRRHAYYQWVPYVLLFQCILFMLPPWLWVGLEGGVVEKLVGELDDELECSLQPGCRNPVISTVADYFRKRCRGSYNLILGLGWVFCDFLALACIIFNFFLTDTLLGGTLMEHVSNMLRFETRSTSNTTTYFPVMTKCSMDKFGPSGSLEHHDSICVMNLNIVYEQIFLLQWGWFIGLSALTVINIVRKLMRVAVMKYAPDYYLEDTKGTPTFTKKLKESVRYMKFGDCVLFHLVGKNMRPVTYQHFVAEIAELEKTSLKETKQY